MGNGRKRLRRSLFSAILFVAIASAGACLSFGELTGGNGADAGVADVVTDVAAPLDGGQVIDSGPTLYASCNETHIALPSEPDGFYTLSSGDGGPPFQAYCDMTTDDGGWMLVTPAMIVTDTLDQVVNQQQIDVNGGLIEQDYPNTNPCGADGSTRPQATLLIAAQPPWKEVRARHLFYGTGPCWSIFGSTGLGTEQNVFTYEPGIDVIHDEVNMGGITADGGPIDDFNDIVDKCAAGPDNFWASNTSFVRSAVVGLHHDILNQPAGLSTNVNCFIGNPGLTSTTWWEYRDIYVR